jgi:predicted ATPase
LALLIAADINKVSLITFEELENSIHPGLFQKLLIIMDGLIENTKVLITSHSPYLIQYIDINKIKIGIPNDKSLAIFKEFKPSKFNKLRSLAEDEGVSTGDFIFDKLIEGTDEEFNFFNEFCK